MGSTHLSYLLLVAVAPASARQFTVFQKKHRGKYGNVGNSPCPPVTGLVLQLRLPLLVSSLFFGRSIGESMSTWVKLTFFTCNRSGVLIVNCQLSIVNYQLAFCCAAAVASSSDYKIRNGRWNCLIL
ncbi:hypothetical protein BZA77DRAFT_114455 [Pyronema omphalodes]|nr:hypothetical protein BZA77DRAFT_114455 [Pyronema omphalodes]